MTNWSEQLYDDLDWRESELASLKKHVISEKPSSSTQLALLRALWCMLYAHYEGFTKFCWELFLNAVENEGVQRIQLISPLLELSIDKECRKLHGDWSTNKLLSFFRTNYPILLTELATFETRLETNSNLWPNVFKTECAKINIACETLDRNQVKLKSLVARRNDIAHGKRMIINNLIEYQPYEDAAILVMYDLAVQVADCLDQKTYMP
jgi:hypothetical protein